MSSSWFLNVTYDVPFMSSKIVLHYTFAAVIPHFMQTHVIIDPVMMELVCVYRDNQHFTETLKLDTMILTTNTKGV